MEEFCQVLISVPSKEEANTISDVLIKKKLIAGSLIINGPSRYWWKGKIVEKEYWNIIAFSMIKTKNEIISEVRKVHSDECPIIAFSRLDGNEDFLEWIKKYVG